MFALVLTGPPGAGKTAVLEALSDALSAEDVRHATVEVEALTSAHPPLDDDQWPTPVRGGLRALPAVWLRAAARHRHRRERR